MKQKGIAPIVIILIIIGVLVFGGLVYYYFQGIRTGEKKPEESSVQKEPVTEAVVSCGEVGPDEPDPTGKIKNCFEDRFKECKPATLVKSADRKPIGLIMGGLVTYYYEIIGPSNGLCLVKSKYLKEPNPEWIGKEMTCKYDNKKDFETAEEDVFNNTFQDPFQNMSGCEGSLYDALVGPLYKNQ